MPGLRHLVLVPGHAVWNLRGDPMNDANWWLKPFQNGEPKYFIEHIEAGVRLAAAEPRAILMFSGGATEKAAGPLTEALGYWKIAEWYGWWGHDVSARAFTEDYALDSFLNLLYGLFRYHQIAGAWPERVTVCGWGFKGRRIAELHRQALRWRRELEYVAVNDPPNREEVAEREKATCREFELDPFGLNPPIAEKRAARDHFYRVPPYAIPALGRLPVFPWEAEPPVRS
jgi:hypothetical protein